jgi:hypothetical protein
VTMTEPSILLGLNPSAKALPEGEAEFLDG